MFLFNLIVGTGALTLPAAFQKTGWLLGLFLIMGLAFISYMTVTFVIETMACANAITYWSHLERLKREKEFENVSSCYNNRGNNWRGKRFNFDIFTGQFTRK